MTIEELVRQVWWNSTRSEAQAVEMVKEWLRKEIGEAEHDARCAVGMCDDDTDEIGTSEEEAIAIECYTDALHNRLGLEPKEGG